MCLDPLFNLQIPRSKPSKIVIRPSKGTFVTGIAKQYNPKYPELLEGVLPQGEFNTMMTNINDMLETYFPCTFCWVFGYLCCIPTLGLSLCGPAVCVNDAEDSLRTMLARMNRNTLWKKKGLHISLVKKCGTSWLELEYFSVDSV